MEGLENNAEFHSNEDQQQSQEQTEDEYDGKEWKELFDDLMDVDQYQRYAENSPTSLTLLPEHLEPISKDSNTTKMELALLVFSFINKHCQGTLEPLKHLLQLLQIALPPSNSFPKTPTQFSQVNREV